MTRRRRIELGAASVAIVCLLALWGLARHDASADPVDTHGGITGRIASGCGRDLTSLEAASSNRVAAMERAAGEGRSDDLDGMLDADARAFDTYRDEVDRCIVRIEDWSVATSALEERLVAPAHEAGTRYATITCDKPDPGSDDSGYVDYTEHRVIHLAGATCYALERVLAHPGALDCARGAVLDYPSCPVDLVEGMEAIVTLAHEEQHIDGVDEEYEAECYAYQHAPAVARALGVADTAAAQVSRFVTNWMDVPPNYRSTQCHTGGGLDLELPGAGSWSFT